jgi:membrane-bound lytic murein transglycosylase D
MKWRLALLAFAALLAGCSGTLPSRPQAAPPVPLPAPAVTVAPPPATSVAAPPAPVEFWQGLRDSFAFARCDGDPRVAAWLQRLTAHPARIEKRMRIVLPQLRYVAALVSAAGLPGEFALVPWVESDFRPLPARGNGPAGIWQIMPATGRSLGLRIDRRYDARLDLYESTRAATRLLQRFDREFHDWRLVDMAYNTGMYRVRERVAERNTPLDDRAVPDIRISSSAANHVAKLTALACIVREPQRYGIALPAASGIEALQRVELAAPLALPVAARLSGVAEADLREFNAAYRDAALPARQLILPETQARRFREAYAQLDGMHWNEWQRIELHQASTLAAMAGDDPDRAALLGQVNQRDASTPLRPGARLWLPLTLAAALPDGTAEIVRSTPPTHRVQAGDNLWDLARRFHVGVADLRAWNGLHGDMLRLGQLLRLDAPDVDGPNGGSEALH